MAIKEEEIVEGVLADKLLNKTARIAVIGLGYVGLSILEAFAEAGFPVLGYDCDQEKVDTLREKKSYLSYLSPRSLHAVIEGKNAACSTDPHSLEGIDVFIIAVPTSLDAHRVPDLSHVEDAAKLLSHYLRQDQLVVMQSTSYPGTTEERVLPLLQSEGLKVGKAFYLSFVPEISDIGNPDFSFGKIPKVIGGVTETCGKLTQILYEHVSEHVYLCSSPKIAEAAKILQNAYRLVNISFINEMKIALGRMGIDIWEVIGAASKKPFGFVPFYPGPGIGGDCIPVDPYYLVWKARETDSPTSLIERAGDINAEMPHYILEKIKDALSCDHKALADAKVLVLGVGFKKDVNDLRESAALKILLLLQQAHAKVSYHDPYVPKLIPSSRYPLSMESVVLEYLNLKEYDCTVIVTDHSFYDWDAVLQYSQRIVDTRNVLRKQDTKVIKA